MTARLARGVPARLRRALARWRHARACVCPRSGILALLVLAVVLATGCAREIELHSGLNEADANELVVTLAAAGVQASKNQVKQGFSVTVAPDQLSFAVSILRAQGLPRFSFARMGDVFKKDGMISTPMEERGRYLFALSQELESTLSQIDGVVLAKVHPVLPERSYPGEPAQVSSCAVFIKHRADFDPLLYEDRIRQLVLAGIPGLGASTERDEVPRPRVSVVFSPVVAPAHAAAASGDQSQRLGRVLVLALGVLLLGGLLTLGYAWRARLAALWTRVHPVAKTQPPSEETP